MQTPMGSLQTPTRACFAPRNPAQPLLAALGRAEGSLCSSPWDAALLQVGVPQVGVPQGKGNAVCPALVNITACLEP